MTTANLPTVAVPYDDLERMGERIYKSGLFGVRSVDQAIALMLVAQAEGLHPAIAARDYHIIDGRPSLKADAMLARFQGVGGKVEWVAYTDERVAARFTHPQGGAIEVDWDMARAKKAQIGGKGAWLKYPRQMLRARVISEGVRATFPGVAAGMYTPEENADIDEPKRPLRDVTPKREARAPADDLAEFAGEHPPKAEPPPAHDAETGEVLSEYDERPHGIRIEMKDGVADWAAWCSDMRDALMAAENEDDLLAIREQNAATMMALSSGGNGGRKAADRLQGVFSGCQLELRRKAAAA